MGFCAVLVSCLHNLGFNQKRCHHCHKPFYNSQIENIDLWPSLRLCNECQKLLEPFRGIACKSCGMPLDSQTGKKLCASCASRRPPWESCAMHGLYGGALRDLLLRLKFNGELHLSRLFAEFLVEAARCLPKPDVLAPIPMHPDNLIKRGYNQANEIARSIAGLTGFHLDNQSLRRIKAGKPQEALTAIERQSNLKKAFSANSVFANKIVWLVDDVMTTGSTCREACIALKNAGARSIHILLVARAAFG